MHIPEHAVDLSIVIPALNEEGNIRELYSRLKEVLDRITGRWEIIVVDDGSSDGTWRLLTCLHGEDPRLRAVRFSRNFGHQYAIFAGLERARGKAVISMDADLQHPPEIIPRLVAEWEQGKKIVHTVRIDTKRQSFLKHLSSRFFYRTYSFLSGVKMEGGMADFRLLDRQIVDAILKFREEGLFLRGLIQWVGYPSAKVTYTCGERFSGSPKYTWGKMVRFTCVGITSFSIVPLRIGIVIGVITSCFAFAELLYAFGVRLFTDTVVPGWASAVCVLSFLFGILFILIGLLGEYIGRVLIEVQNRPKYLIQEELDSGSCLEEIASSSLSARGGPASGGRSSSQ